MLRRRVIASSVLAEMRQFCDAESRLRFPTADRRGHWTYPAGDRHVQLLPCLAAVKLAASAPARFANRARGPARRAGPLAALLNGLWPPALHHAAHAAHVGHAPTDACLLGGLGDDRPGHEDVLRDRSGVLERRARDHG